MSDAAATGASARRRWWTLAVLALVAFIATVDRQAFVVLLVPIQKQLQVGDAAMGFLMGSAFALAQAAFSLPMGRLVDRTNRRNLLALALAAWSLATALGGLASTFAALVVARLVVGAAEAAQTPATASLVGDLFDANRRGAAFTFCSVGMGLGVSFGAYAGGKLSDLYGWNAALFAVGAPGLVVALMLYLTVPEPRRAGALDTRPAVALSQMLRACLAIRTLPPFVVAFAALQGAVFAWFVWFPVLLMRVHGLSAAQMGSIFGTVVLCGVASALWIGPVSDVFARRGARRRVQFLVAIAALSAPLMLASALAPSLQAATWCAIGFTLIAGGHHPVAMATYASLSPPRVRGSVAAVVYLVVTLAGGAGAPFVFGLVNDALSARYAEQTVRYTLLLAPVLLAVAAVFFRIAARTVDDDTAAAERPEPGRIQLL
ncbi:MFS transporter [Tahibacter soli]|uniref:MFS transporter n=1 Tax=Tahibacter soli TaxID=2983605 RepID=A0A9X4BJN6_9GAMM|nr:MFS transporter [Tahibacter soli]MDC8015296.1 MFS transporter [Tahibacter soli]